MTTTDKYTAETSVSKPTLWYFPARGRAEASRLIFYLNGVDFENKLVTKDKNWDKVKPLIATGQVPALQLGDKFFPQSLAIMTYASRKGTGKLAITDAEEDLVAQSLIMTIEDSYPSIRKYFYAENDEEKQKIKEDLLANVLPAQFATFNKVASLSASTSGFLFSKLSYVDIAIYCTIMMMQEMFGVSDDLVRTNAPRLFQMREAVAALPELQAYQSTDYNVMSNVSSN